MPVSQQNVYREIAKAYLHESVDYRQLAGRTTDMLIASAFAMVATLLAVLMTILSGGYRHLHSMAMPRCVRVFNCILLTLTILFVIMLYPLWKGAPSFKWFQSVSDSIPMVERLLERHTYVETLIKETPYLDEELKRLQDDLGVTE